jgi:SpoVK/Ycf46/Vps4 family AAA+-type ATPase
MFTKIQDYIEDPQALVCVLVDEVESLTHARQSSLAGTEPSDSLRVVNTLLTQIDQIRRYSNCHVHCSFIETILCALRKESTDVH